MQFDTLKKGNKLQLEINGIHEWISKFNTSDIYISGQCIEPTHPDLNTELKRIAIEYLTIRKDALQKEFENL